MLRPNFYLVLASLLLFISFNSTVSFAQTEENTAPPATTDQGSTPQPAQPPAAIANSKTSDADPINALEQAKFSYVNGEFTKSLEALWEAEETIWNMAPLGVRHIAFTTEQAEGSSYIPKQGETFNGTEPIFLYFEPIGYTQKKGPQGYESSMRVSFEVVDSTGKVLGGQKDLGPYEIKGGRNFTTNYVISMTIGIKNLEPGEYTLRVTIDDNLNPAKTVQFDKAFIIS